jgi:2-polyprenyl-3-methyl-5-hydroxy-6-metoxy-1,4-benzoquinol methylase
MTNPRKEKWEKRYLGAEPSLNIKPAIVLLENKHLLPAGGTALDLACGLGDSALWLAQQGYSVNAWDYSNNAVTILRERANLLGLEVHTQCNNAQNISDVKSKFDIIVVRYFLDRELCDAISQALKPNGLLFYETFNEEKLKDSSSMNSTFVLKHGEILRLFNNLQPIYHYEFNNNNALFAPKKGMLRNTSYVIFKKLSYS